MSGILYVVATPIGNLEDLTFRALRVLREVPVIAAEDTRHTRKLLQHYSISTPATSLHGHNERRRTPQLVARLTAGESVALVSDAGTPLVSDPGAYLVAAAHAAGVQVVPIPGASAAVAALSAAGFEAAIVHFAGFPPARGSARNRWFDRLATLEGAVVFFEAPHRVRETLGELQSRLGDVTLAVGRELTKVHEDLVVRPISAHLQRQTNPRGEYVLVLKTGEQPQSIDLPEGGELRAEFGDMTNLQGLSRREALRRLAGKYGISSREMYSRLEEALKSVE